MKTKYVINSTTSLSNMTTWLQKADAIIEIVSDRSLGKTQISMKESSTIIFNGGMLTNVTYSGYMNFKTMQNQIFDATVSFAEGTILNVPYIRPEWFGAKGKYKKTEKSVGRDYDDTSTGRLTPHDDSNAINQAICVAEQLSIKIVKFSAANYYIGSGIIINKGNIWLQGSGALLREDQGGTKDSASGIDYSNTRTTTSTLYCKDDEDGANGRSILTCAKTVSDPIYISNLQFFNDMENVACISALQSVAIDFKATYWGPTWPVIIERCHFAWFCKAFRVNSDYLNTTTKEKRAYPLHLLQIRNCAFYYNNYCVYSEKVDDTVNSDKQRTWSFEFINNCCHANNKIIEIAVFKGMCRIENNNCECSNPDSRPYTDNKGQVIDPVSSFDDQYAIDVDISQRATAIIRHNHFEGNNSFLIRVNGKDGPGTKAIVERNNTDGMSDSYVKYNKCYFYNVELETDMPYVETYNCIIERAIPCTSSFMLAEGGEVTGGQGQEKSAVCALLKHRGNHSLNYPKYVIDNFEGVTPKVFVNTPYGRQCLSYYHTTQYSNGNNLLLFSETLDYSAQNPYLNIEFPYYKEGTNPVACYMPIVISYYDSNNQKIGHRVAIPSGHNYKSEGGYYLLRLECKLTNEESVAKVNIQVYVATGYNSLYPEDRLYIGSRTLVFSDKKLDLNDDFQADPNMHITGNTNDHYILCKGDTFISGCYEVRCLEDGCVLPNQVFSSYDSTNGTIKCTSENNNGAVMVPIGSTWTKNGFTFKICGIKQTEEVSKSYTFAMYQIEVLANGTFTDGTCSCKPPVLLGHGRGTTAERNLPIAGKLCSGSTFYDTTLGKIYHLNNALQWVE